MNSFGEEFIHISLPIKFYYIENKKMATFLLFIEFMII